MAQVSIIMPVYNKEKYLEKSIRSVLNQSYKDFELIIVDDGSTDNSFDISKKFQCQDSRITVIHTKNAGVSNARNVGLIKSTGQWIQFLDGDDYLDSDYLTNVSSLLNDNTLDIIFSQFEKVDHNGNIVEKVFVSELGYKNSDSFIDDFMKYQYDNGFYGFISNKLIRKSIVDSCEAKFPIGVTLAEDLAFYISIYKNIKRIYYCNFVSFYYLQTSQNYVFNSNIDYIDQAEIQISIKDWMLSKNNYRYIGFINKKICDYACYSIFDGFERNLNVKNILIRLSQNSKILNCIEHKYTRGLNSIIAYSILHKNYRLLVIVFSVRKSIRNIYRRLK